MLADCATPSVQVNKSSLVVHRDQEGGTTYNLDGGSTTITYVRANARFNITMRFL